MHHPALPPQAANLYGWRGGSDTVREALESFLAPPLPPISAAEAAERVKVKRAARVAERTAAS
jgi:hypothetical protein